MASRLVCFDPRCGGGFAIDDVLYECPRCQGLLAVENDFSGADAKAWRDLWDARRASRAPLDVSGVWRFRELLPFAGDGSQAVTIREGNTPLFEAPAAASFAGLDALELKHQGYNPTASFKDNGMTAGATQARRLGMQRVACVSTGNTSASMAAYAAAAGMQAIVFLPRGKIAYGKLAQALEYGALTIQVEANFDRILTLVRELAAEVGIYLLNSINPFRIEGQKSIVTELLDQRNWRVPDWIVLPGGNLGNVSALGKGLRVLLAIGVIDRLPRVAVVQAAGAAPFFDYYRNGCAGRFQPVADPETLATAIRIGDPVSWPKAAFELARLDGVVESVTEQEIAHAKAVIGRCGIGCEPASAASVAGIKKLAASGRIRAADDVVAVLTGHLLKDPDYVYRYHTGELQAPSGEKLSSGLTNAPVVMPPSRSRIAELLEASAQPV